jgi:hypothetical protein
VEKIADGRFIQLRVWAFVPLAKIDKVRMRRSNELEVGGFSTMERAVEDSGRSGDSFGYEVGVVSSVPHLFVQHCSGYVYAIIGALILPEV